MIPGSLNSLTHLEMLSVSAGTNRKTQLKGREAQHRWERGEWSDVRIDSSGGERSTADSGVLVSFPHPHHSHLPLTLTLDE